MGDGIRSVDKGAGGGQKCEKRGSKGLSCGFSIYSGKAEAVLVARKMGDEKMEGEKTGVVALTTDKTFA